METNEVGEWAKLIGMYYRALVREQLPNEMIGILVAGWQSYMLELVKRDQTAPDKSQQEQGDE